MYRYSLNTIFTAVGDYQVSVTHTLAHQLFQKTLAQICSHYKPQDHLIQCFISYAWARANALPNSAEKAHEAYAEKIALDLQSAGFSVLFDKWHDRAGKDINDFVEKILDESTHFILPIGTELYLKKYQKRNELSQNKNHVVRAEGKLLNYLVTFNDQHSERVIPLLLEGTAEQSLPPLLRPKIPIFLTENYFHGMFKLIRDLYKIDQQDQKFKQITAHFVEQLEVINQSVTNEMQVDYEARLQDLAKGNTIKTQEEVKSVLTALLSTSLILGKINDYHPLVNVPNYNYLTNLPSENPEFVGRKELLENISQGWKIGNISIQTLIQGSSDKQNKLNRQGKHTQQTLAGLGGVGKTQSALAYAHAQNNLPKTKRPCFVRWMNAEGAQVSTALRELAIQFNPKAREQTDAEMIVMLYQQLKTIPRWLLIFDNVDTYEAIKPYLPPIDYRQPGQHVLITSRSRAWPSQLVNTIEMDGFTPNEAIDYLAQFQPELNNPSNTPLREAAFTLAKELGYLPLALSHAVAYMQKKKLGLELYLQRYREAGLAVLKEHPQDEVLPYPHTVLTTWVMAIEELTVEYPEAIVLLNHVAYLAPQIKRADLNSWLKLFNDETGLDRAIEGLSQYSLVSIRQIDQKDTLVFHRLVQAVTREQQSPLEQKEYYQYDVQSVYEQVKVNETDWNNPVYWPRLLTMLEHAQQLLTPEWAEAWFNKAVWRLGECVFQYFLAQSNLGEAMNYAEQGLRLVKNQHHEEAVYEDIATRHGLGLVLQAQGKLSEAQAKFEEALSMQYHVYGAEAKHPEIAATLHNLAIALQSQDKLSEAHMKCEASLAMHYHIYGSEAKHQEIAATLHELGRVLQAQGKLSGAQAKYEASLAMKYHVYGSEAKHPDIAATLHELGRVLQAQAKLSEAQVKYEASLTMYYHVYGSETKHPDIVTNLCNLSIVSEQQHHFSEAERYVQQTLTIQKSVFGETHPVTRKTEVYLNKIQARRYLVSQQGLFAQRTDSSSIPGSKNKSTLENSKKI